MILTIFSGWHIIIIMLGIVFLFGGKKIPELMKGIGEGIKEFKKATKEDDHSTSSVTDKKPIDKE